MPLVVPGIMTNPEDKNQEWANKLVGKTFSESDESNETVSVFPSSIYLSGILSRHFPLIRAGKLGRDE